MSLRLYSREIKQLVEQTFLTLGLSQLFTFNLFHHIPLPFSYETSRNPIRFYFAQNVSYLKREQNIPGIFRILGKTFFLITQNWVNIGPLERYWNSLQRFCFEFFLIPYLLSGAGILVTKHILKDALLLKCLPRTNGKEVGKTQNQKVVANFMTFPMV